MAFKSIRAEFLSALLRELNTMRALQHISTFSDMLEARYRTPGLRSLKAKESVGDSEEHVHAESDSKDLHQYIAT
jgi:hypothetical protein